MKTLKLKRLPDGRFDIDTQYNRSIILESDNIADRKTIAEQRVLKAVTSKRNFFEPRYGLEITKYIGSNQKLFLGIRIAFENLRSFYRSINNRSGTAAIDTNVTLNTTTGQITCPIKTVSGNTEVSLGN